MGSNRAAFGNRKNKKGVNRYKQGIYNLENVEKYIGILPIRCYSSWEFAFCRYCDMSNNISKWSSESLAIPYQTTNDNGKVEIHRYYPDFYVEMVDTTNSEKHDRLVIEIKPKHETEFPKAPQKQTTKTLETYQYSLKTFKTNLHKWAFTKEWCERHHLKFLIITEVDLKNKGIIK